MNKIEQLMNGVNQTIEQAMKGEQSTMDKFSEVKGGDGKIAVKRVYDFVNTVGKRDQLTTFDPEVIRITETIARAIMHREKSSFIICRELYHMRDSGKLKSLGFKNVGEYGKAMFDLAPLTCNQYARIGEYFINDDYNIVGDMPRLSVSHYIEMLSFIEKKGGSLDELRDMFLNGTLTDGMSTKDIRLALNAAKESKSAIETTFSDSEAEQTSEAEQAATFDKAATLQKGLDAIQTLYRVSETLKANGIDVNFTSSLDEVMEGIKSLF